MSSQNTVGLNLLDANISKIKGPKSIHILKPKKIKDVNQNYIILLGDDHNDPLQPEPQGTDIDKFLFELNKLAKFIRCDFYIEHWNVNQLKSLQEYNKRKKNDFIEKISNSDSAIQKYANADSLTELDMKHIKYIKYKKFSDLNIVKWSNKSCFFKFNACRYKNLKWQYGDLRQKLDKMDGYDHCNLNYFLDVLNPLFDKLKKQSITIKIINELIEYTEEYGENVLHLFITDIKSLINDRLNFINNVLSDPIMKKQIKKMNPETKKLFSKTNILEFLNLYQTYYDKKYHSTNVYESYNNIANSILEFKSASQERKENIVEYLNSIDLTSEQIDDFYGVIGLGSMGVLDMYFLMRIFKQDPVINKKIVVGYFGSDHCYYTSKFLENVLKTHTLIYNDNIYNVTSPRKYIEITKKIFLPINVKEISKTSHKRSSRNSHSIKLRNTSIRSRFSNPRSRKLRNSSIRSRFSNSSVTKLRNSSIRSRFNRMRSTRKKRFSI